MTDIQAPSQDAREWSDPLVQDIYRLLIAEDEPPAGEHWEGWIARRLAAHIRSPATGEVEYVTKTLVPFDDEDERFSATDTEAMRLLREARLFVAYPLHANHPNRKPLLARIDTLTSAAQDGVS